jgi:1,4-alpha-glucan branching enzyme
MTEKPARKKATEKTPAKDSARGPAEDQAKQATAAATPTARPVADEELDRLAGGAHHDPHSVLGAHPHAGRVTVRALRPGAAKVTIAIGDEQQEMRHERAGVWVALLERADVPDYRLLVDYGDKFEHRQDDPYRYLPTLGEMDLHLIGEGPTKICGRSLARTPAATTHRAARSTARRSPYGRRPRAECA